MSPRSADPAVRAALLAAAKRLLSTEGPQALSTRRLATEVGASSIAVYTHFGSMDQLRRELRRDGFGRLEADLDAIPRTDDPVADLGSAILAYFAFGLGDPDLYRAMFVDRPPERTEDAGTGVFERLVAAVDRCVDAGRFEPAEPALLRGWSAELWTAGHGMITLALTGLLPLDQVRFLLTDMTCRLAVGFGDDPAAASRSIETLHSAQGDLG
ncbi:TetR/AcrR family transcriptional regulator [Fodinicola acaciae]|uniref:TetR/AcrR family transcriptional regulator n=1 Tax=Fodinicola acaciae TaxID=2681555 RepID=UPI0013D5F69D|nr:TetR/AcrR family transcriptional regulator [Fodinicola acaciae]